MTFVVSWFAGGNFGGDGFLEACGGVRGSGMSCVGVVGGGIVGGVIVGGVLGAGTASGRAVEDDEGFAARIGGADLVGRLFFVLTCVRARRAVASL